MQWQGKKVLVGITGSIAAYKAIVLVRLLVRAGAEVKVVLTPAANEFVSPLTLSTLSGHAVVSSLAQNDEWANHVMLGRWADLMIIAPLSCNTLAKMAYGLCDNMLMAVYLSATCPVLACPAMDEDMWHHGTTQSNLERIASHGVQVMHVAEGLLASGLTGAGRMQEPEAIFEAAYRMLKPATDREDLSGKQCLVTAGPTFEPLDPVRYIGNHSSGKMGIALARALKLRGAEVTLVLGPTREEVPEGLQVMRITTAQQMMDAVLPLHRQMDVLVFAAAVADFRPVAMQEHKIKKTESTSEVHLTLVPNPDILAYCGTHKLAHQVIVGFALETQQEKEHALAKLHKKNANLIVLNSLNDTGAGFGLDTNAVTVFTDDGREYRMEVASKDRIAQQIVDAIIEYRP